MPPDPAATALPEGAASHAGARRPLQDEFEVAYAAIVVVSVDPPEVQSAFRAGLGARFTFLSDA